MKNIEKYKGIIIALYACYEDNGSISYERTKKLVRFYVNTGVKGLYVNGSSGEGLLLSLEERKEVLEVVMQEAGEELTIIAHIAANSTRDSIELARHAHHLNVDAISAIPNIYYRIPESSIENYWLDIIRSVDSDFIIYNIPQTTGYQLSLNLFKKMINNKKVIGVKNSSMSTLDIQQFKQHGGEDFLVFNGPDEQYIAGRMMGADGGIGGTYGVMPELFVKLEDYIEAGEMKEAIQLQFQINEIIMSLLAFPNLYSAIKEILKLSGINIGTTRLPLEPVPKERYHEIEELYNKIQKLYQYYGLEYTTN